MSRLDVFYRRLLLTKFFAKGWGKPDNLKRIFEFRKIISDRALCRHLVPSDHPITINKEEVYDDYRLLTGHFQSPFNMHMPGIMPDVVKTAHFQMVLPKVWKGPLKPMCIHLAGTGDHKFRRRRVMMAKPLLKESGIGSVILENPYYGVRKPKNQFRSSLDHVSDLFVMGGALVLESIALFHWLESQGFGPLGITGISLGGHMASVTATNWHRPLSCVPCLSWTTASIIFTQNASLAASNWHKPLSLVPCLSWSTASSVFTKGVLSGAIPWKHLQQQFQENDVYGTVLSKLIHSPEKSGRTKTDAFLLGQQFHNYVDQIDSAPDSADPQPFDTTSILWSKSDLGSSANSLGSKSKGVGLDNGAVGSSRFSTLAATSKSDPNNTLSRNHQQSLSSSTTASSSNASTATPRTSSWNIHQRLLKSFQGNGSSKELSPDAFEFMCGVMDECTHLGNFSVPVDPKLIIIVSAKNDAYVPRDRVMSLAELWPGAEQRFINCGHIGAFLLNSYIFRDAIRDSFDRQIAAYYTLTDT